MTKVFTIGGYTLRCHIKPVLYPEDHFHIRFTSTWEGSRWPTYERELLNFTLSRTALTKLGSIINLALAYGSKP